MSYNPSIFDDKISVLAQVETLKQVVKDHEEEIDGKFVITGNEIAAVESHVKEVETQLGFVSSDVVNAVDLASEAAREAAKAIKLPPQAPIATQLVGVNNTNEREMITLGSGLAIEDGVLNTAGGGGGLPTNLLSYGYVFQTQTSYNPFQGPEGTLATAAYRTNSVEIHNVLNSLINRNKILMLIVRTEGGFAPGVAFVTAKSGALSGNIYVVGDYGNPVQGQIGIGYTENQDYQLYTTSDNWEKMVVTGIYLIAEDYERDVNYN